MSAPLHIRVGQVWRNLRQLSIKHDPQREILSIDSGIAVMKPVGFSQDSYLAQSRIRLDRISPANSFELLFDPAPEESSCPQQLQEAFAETVVILKQLKSTSQLERAAVVAASLGRFDAASSFVCGSLLRGGVWQASYWAEAAGFIFDPSVESPLPGEIGLSERRRTVRSSFSSSDPLLARTLLNWQQNHPLAAASLGIAAD